MKRSNFLPELSIKTFKQILDRSQADPLFVIVYDLNIFGTSVCEKSFNSGLPFYFKNRREETDVHTVLRIYPSR